MFDQAFCKAVVGFFSLPVCIMLMDIVSDWGTFTLPSIIKQESHESSFQAILIGHAKRE